MSAAGSDSGAPWYRCFWPWFIIGLLGTAVSASIATGVIAASGSDSLVRDDYYKDGMAINRRFEREQLAASLGVVAGGRIDAVTGDVVLELEGAPAAAAVTLDLSHPTRSELDAHLSLRRAADGIYRGELEAPLRGARFYATLEPDPVPDGGAADAWRVSESVVIEGERLRIGPER